MSEEKPVSLELSELDGVGDAISKKLIELGYHNIAVLASASSAIVATKLAKPQKFAEDLIIQAHNYIQVNKVLERGIISTKEQLEREKKTIRFSSGSKNIDKLLGDRKEQKYGVEVGAVTEFVAEAASGKSQICFQLAVMATLPKEQGGLGKNVLYIDTEQTYKATRVNQIVEERNLDPEILDKIFIRKPEAAVFLELIVKDLFKLIDNYDIGLVIVDSFSNLHRQEFLGREHLAERQHKFSQMLSTLVKVAQQGIAVVVTNQVLQNPNGNAFMNPNIAVGGTVVGHGTTHRIFLTKKGVTNVYYNAKVVDSPSLPPEETTYKITPKGVEDYNAKTKTIGETVVEVEE